jgi:PTH1 family peptidyl-tRNA hydrolase
MLIEAVLFFIPNQKNLLFLHFQSQRNMKYLIVGLGNIGAEYAQTRHNIGFMVLDYMAKKAEATWSTERYADCTEIKHKGRSLHLIKPNTYMNLSGKAVNYWLQELKIPIENLLVIVDDLAIAHATLRLRQKGSAGGHNGLASIEECIGTSNYARLRFGIGNDYPKGKQADYVLSNFTEDQMIDISLVMDKAVDGIQAFAMLGIERAMNVANS